MQAVAMHGRVGSHVGLKRMQWLGCPAHAASMEAQVKLNASLRSLPNTLFAPSWAVLAYTNHLLYGQQQTCQRRPATLWPTPWFSSRYFVDSLRACSCSSCRRSCNHCHRVLDVADASFSEVIYSYLAPGF